MLLARNIVPVNRFPIWKYLLIGIVILFAVIYALPNLFGETPAIQIAPQDGKSVTDSLLGQIKSTLARNHIAYHHLTQSAYSVEMRFTNTDAQMLAQETLQQALGDKATVAMNLAANTPKWLLALGAEPMKLGLDLRGGMYFLLDVDMQTVLQNHLESIAAQLRTDLHSQRLSTQITVKPNEGILLDFSDVKVRNRIKNYIQSHYQDLTLITVSPKWWSVSCLSCRCVLYCGSNYVPTAG
jgi:preprotein translocase subunit SecD